MSNDVCPPFSRPGRAACWSGSEAITSGHDEEVGREQKEQVARCWQAAEDDSQAIDEMVDMVLASEEDDA